MTKKEAKGVIQSEWEGAIIMEVEDTGFGDGSHTIVIANVFESKQEAERVMQAIRKLIE